MLLGFSRIEYTSVSSNYFHKLHFIEVFGYERSLRMKVVYFGQDHISTEGLYKRSRNVHVCVLHKAITVLTDLTEWSDEEPALLLSLLCLGFFSTLFYI